MDTVSTIRHFVAVRLEIPDEAVGVDDDLRALPNFDSLRALQIVLDVEELFDIEVEDHVVFETRTVGEFAAKIDEMLAERGSRVGS
jgi:acyl carrier protein